MSSHQTSPKTQSLSLPPNIKKRPDKRSTRDGHTRSDGHSLPSPSSFVHLMMMQKYVTPPSPSHYDKLIPELQAPPYTSLQSTTIALGRYSDHELIIAAGILNNFFDLQSCHGKTVRLLLKPCNSIYLDAMVGIQKRTHIVCSIQPANEHWPANRALREEGSSSCIFQNANCLAFISACLMYLCSMTDTKE